MITDLDSDGDGEVSKKELKNVFAKLFPGANFEATWEELDSDGSGSLTTKELANHFGMGHLVTGTKEVRAPPYIFISTLALAPPSPSPSPSPVISHSHTPFSSQRRRRRR